MRRRLVSAKSILGLFAALIVVLAGWLYLAPPELLRVGAAYSAKIVCSNVFLADRDPAEVLAVDVQAPGHPLLKLMRVTTDHATRTVTAAIFGVIAPRTAVARDGLGCTVLPEDMQPSELAAALPGRDAPAATANALWPEGEGIEPSQTPAMTAILDDPAMTGPGMRAVVVVKGGKIVAERYASGFSAETPLLGWSMAKTVSAAIIGTLVKDGRLSLDDKRLFGDWRTDGRSAISIADLLGMSSGLEFNEDYGDVTDVTRMLFLEPDMAAFAAAKPLTGPVGANFSYSSGTTMLLSRLWQEAAGEQAMALPSTRLFEPLGMHSAVLEMDAAGTFVGSSFLYATARDWARFGQFLLQDGVWGDLEILPAGFAAWMREPAPASNGNYGRGHLWLGGPSSTVKDDAAFGLPKDIVWMIGHDGQSVAIIPSQRLVVVRMGLTPSKFGYRPQAMVAALAKALAQE